MKKHTLTYSWLACVLVAVAILMYSFFSSDIENTAISNETLMNFSNSWHVTLDGEDMGVLDLPYTLSAEEHSLVELRHDIPTGLKQNSTLFFRSSQSFVRILIDGEEHYSFGYNSLQSFSASPGSSWQIMRIPQDSFGKELTIELTSPFARYSGDLRPIYIGTKAAIIFAIFVEHLPNLVLAAAMLIAGVLMIGIGFVTRGANMYHGLFHLGCFSLLLFMWTLCESKLLQFFCGDTFLLTNLTFITLLLLPIPFVLFLTTLDIYSNDKLLKCSLVLFFLIFVVVNLLVITNTYEYLLALPALMISAIATGIYACGKLIYHYINGKRVKLLALAGGTVTLMVFVAVACVTFLFGKSEYGSLLVSLGFLAFILIVGVWSLKRTLATYSANIEQATLAALAYTDILTKLPNRTAFEDRLAQYSQVRTGAILLMFDLNDLKAINDTCSHREGDAALVLAARLLQDCFAPMGECYRIGGDEFCVVGDLKKAALEPECQEALRKSLYEANLSRSMPISIAYGTAAYYNNGDNIEDVLDKADKEMYKRKAQMKSHFSQNYSLPRKL